MVVVKRCYRNTNTDHIKLNGKQKPAHSSSGSKQAWLCVAFTRPWCEHRIWKAKKRHNTATPTTTITTSITTTTTTTPTTIYNYTNSLKSLDTIKR